MGVRSLRHQVLLDELVEWWEDVSTRGIRSRVVLIEVPARWGVTTVLREFKEIVGGLDGPVTLLVSLDEVLSAGRAMEADALSAALLAPLDLSPLAKLGKRFGWTLRQGRQGWRWV